MKKTSIISHCKETGYIFFSFFSFWMLFYFCFVWNTNIGNNNLALIAFLVIVYIPLRFFLKKCSHDARNPDGCRKSRKVIWNDGKWVFKSVGWAGSRSYLKVVKYIGYDQWESEFFCLLLKRTIIWQRLAVVANIASTANNKDTDNHLVLKHKP